MANEKVTAPFTEDQVASINVYQKSGIMHPFTCGNEKHRKHFNLVASIDGMICPDKNCDYIQNWVHTFMAEWDVRYTDLYTQIKLIMKEKS